MHECSVLKLLQVFKMYCFFGGVLCTRQGHMVAKGTYTELLQSGVDFISLLKKDEEEEQPPLNDTPSRIRTMSQNSVVSTASSLHSVKDGEHLPVGSVFCIQFFCILLHWCGVFSETLTQSIVVWTGREGADCAGGESSSGKHRTETLCQILEVWSQRCGFAGCPVFQHCGTGTWRSR